MKKQTIDVVLNRNLNLGLKIGWHRRIHWTVAVPKSIRKTYLTTRQQKRSKRETFLDFDTADKGTSSKNTKSCRRKKERKIDKRRTQPRNHKSFTIFLTNFKALEKDMSRKDLFFDAVQNAERPVI